ncbi:cell envelope integrity protein TolA [Inhella sp.]|uniref:cell envelope integrity protein TolA n=1 Tax=Inhella sp. TaxID=1921806 RepID=UPI0035B40803
MSTLALPSRPVHQGDGGRSLLLALAAHGLLVWALAHGVNWRASSESAVAEAELWSVVPQAAAPKAEEPPPPEPVRPPTAPPREVVQPPKVEPEADIAQERERRRKEELRKAAEQEEQQRKAREQRRIKEMEKLEALRKQEAEKTQAREAKAEEARREKQRQDNLRRIQGLAGGSGAPGSTGTAAQASGPSAGYAGRIVARIQPRIVYTDAITARWSTLVEVRCAPDGLVLGRKVVTPSGNPAWDEAVLRAIDSAQRIPRDTDGTVPSSFTIAFNSRD